MQTFLPFPDIENSLFILDGKRLNKQKLETAQILNILLGDNPKAAWRNHPAVLMWKGYEECLKLYFNACIDICVHQRKFKNNYDKYIIDKDKLIYPWWFGNENFHLSHKSNLMRKAPNHYSQYFTCPNNILYLWPVNETQTFKIVIPAWAKSSPSSYSVLE